MSMLTEAEQQDLLTVARNSIAQGLSNAIPLAVAVDEYSEALRAQRSAFVTLELDGRLRGCIGSLQPARPLVTEISHNACAAAFSDPRFTPVSMDEAARLDIHISILQPAQAMTCASENALVSVVRPGTDGLILEDGVHHATFLPSVWQQLLAPRDFIHALKRKAGLPSDYWSDTLRVSRYTTESF